MKRTATLALTLLAALSLAQSVGVIRGSLPADHFRDHVFTIGPGVWTVDITDANGNDLDVQVFNQAGRLVDQDLLPDSNPIAEFSSDRTQRFTIRVINADRDGSARYSGTVE